jgi:hypothetical protein
MCSRCKLTVPTGADAYCSACAIDLRLESRRGLEQLDCYLGVWADFDDWITNRMPGDE